MYNEKTLQRLRDQGIQWKGMRGIVRRFIQTCPVCQKLSRIQPEIFAKPYTVSSRGPMEVINIDNIGPLKFLDEPGLKYILVFIDCFTRFIELFATDSTSAESYARALFQFIGRYGIPYSIRTDRGPDFVSQISQQMSILAGIQHHFTLAYSKEENAIAERSNLETMRHLRAIFLEGGIKELFPEDLWIVQRIINSSVHSSIGVSPATLLFGGQIDLDRKILHNNESSTLEQPLNEWLKQRLDHQDQLLKAAIEHQQEIDVENLQKRLPIDLTHFPVGSFVLAKYPPSRMGNLPSSKLQSYWQGPFEVIRTNGDEYIVKDLVSEEEKSFHIKNLKPFHFLSEFTDPTEVAMTEAQQVLVESVLSHRVREGGNPNFIRDTEFLLRWKGRDDRFDQWTKWQDVRANTLVHDYMRTHNLGSKIPKEFRS